VNNFIETLAGMAFFMDIFDKIRIKAAKAGACSNQFRFKKVFLRFLIF
jgi:hypothetical protein